MRVLWPLTAAMNAPRDTTLAGRPIASLTFALNYAAAPSDAHEAFAATGTDLDSANRFARNVWGYHTVNLGIHLLAALCVFGVIRRTLAAPRLARSFSSEAGHWIALAVTAIWVVHPLTTGAVTYLVQRVESLMALFYLLALYCAIRAAEMGSGTVSSPQKGSDPIASAVRRRLWISATVVACLLGMGTKEAMVTAPLMVVAWDYLFDGRPWRETVRHRWPLYAALASTWLLLGWILAMAPRGASVGVGLKGVTSWSYLTTQAGVLIHYLRLTFVPWPLCLDYEWPIASSMAQVVVPGLVMVALCAGTLVGLVRRAAWSMAGVGFFLILAPTSSVVPIVTEVAAEQRMYLPLVAIIATVVAGLFWTLQKWRASDALMPTVIRVTAVALAVAVVAGLGSLTYARNLDYHSEERLYRQTIEVSPANARARNNLATILIGQHRAGEAEPLLREAVRLNPAYPEAQANLGVALAVQGHAAEALPFFERAVAIEPDYGDAWRNYGEALASLGRFREAVPAYQQALASRPDDVRLLATLSWILSTADQADARNGRLAVELAQKAMALSNDSPADLLDTLAAAYAEAGQFAEAVAAAEKALALARGRPDLGPAVEFRLQLYRAGHPFHER